MKTCSSCGGQIADPDASFCPLCWVRFPAPSGVGAPAEYAPAADRVVEPDTWVAEPPAPRVPEPRGTGYATTRTSAARPATPLGIALAAAAVVALAAGGFALREILTSQGTAAAPQPLTAPAPSTDPGQAAPSALPGPTDDPSMAPTEPSEQPSENPGFGADTSPAQPTDTASASASTATDSTPTDTPPPEEGPLVALPPGSSTDAVAQAVDSTLSAYFAAINEKRMSDAWQLYSSSLQTKVGGYDRWISGYGSTSDDNISVATISTSSDSVVAHVRFDSHQDPQDAPDSTSTCVHWRIVYVLAPSQSSGTGYMIDNVRGDVPKGDKPYEPCA